MDKFNALLAQATEEEVQKMMTAFETWYAVHYPDWEVYYMAVPKDPVKKKEHLRRIFEFIQKQEI